MNGRVHASCIAIGGRAVLLFGPSGAGKSDLALRLIDEGATLVSDDYTDLRAKQETLLASAPAHIHGQMEVRGLGIMRVAAVNDVPVSLVVELERSDQRLPEAASRTVEGIALPLVRVDAGTASACARVRLALQAFGLPGQ